MWRKMMVYGALGGLVASGTAAGRVHTVRAGETLGGIAQTYGVSVPALAQVNGLADPNRIAAGSALAVPGPAASAPSSTVPAPRKPTGSSHTMQFGETL
ncbi:MAG TPA: LysM domain-containing protein, partial [Acidimicrobiia bacterium]|nr:LysM domain-containing protein [Acidimicrobiia bacterium]